MRELVLDGKQKDMDDTTRCAEQDTSMLIIIIIFFFNFFSFPLINTTQPVSFSSCLSALLLSFHSCHVLSSKVGRIKAQGNN
jgi:hypothetical protein